MPEQKLNGPRLKKLTACALLIAVLGGGLYAYRVHHIHAGFLAMRSAGLKSSAAGDSSRAVELLGQYLSRYPDDTQVLIAYAHDCPLVELPNNENLSRAIWALRHLLRLDPGQKDARRQLMALYVKTGYQAEALDAADAILSTRIGETADPSAAAELIALGLEPSAHATQSSKADAASIHAKLIGLLQKSPDALDALGVRARSLLQLQRYTESLTACNWWVDADPSDVEPALLRVELMQNLHRPQQEAGDLAEKWVKQNPSAAADDSLLVGHTDLVYGRIAKAQSSLADAARLPLASVAAARILVADLDAVRRTEEARTVLIRLLEREPKEDSVRFILIGRDWESGHLPSVVDLSSSFQTSSPPTYVLALRVSALMALGKKDEADKVLKTLSDRKADLEAAAWVVLIQQSMSQHPDSTQILSACLAALEQNPRDYYLRHFMAQCYAQQGERDLAAREWQRVIREDQTWATPAIGLSKILLDQDHPDQALQVAADAYARAPKSVEAALATAEAWTANIEAGHSEGSDQCLKLIDELGDALPHDGRPTVLKSQLLAAMGQVPKAADSIQRALASTDSLPEQSWIQLATLSEAKHLHLEQSCLARSQKEHGITPTLAYAKAVCAGDPKAGLASFDADQAAAETQHQTQPQTQAANATSAADVLAADPSANPALGWDLSRAAYLELIHDPAALDAWSKLADRNSKVVAVQHLVLNVQSVRADRELSARCIDRIGQLCGHQDTGWRTARARWLIDFAPFLDANHQPTPEAVEARNLLNDLVRQTPDSTDDRVLSAQAYERIGKLADCVSDLRDASNLSPGVVWIRLYLARLLDMEGDFDAANEQLEHLTDADLVGTEQRRQAAAMFAQQGQMDRAIKLLEEDASAGKEADTASLLLARLYQRRGDLPKAEAILNKLLAGHPNAAALRFGADFLASKGSMEQAHVLLDRIGKDAKTEPGVPELIRADFAMRYEPEKAIGLFEAATRSAPGNPYTWSGLTAADLYFNHPDRALAAANDGLKAIPGDPTLSAIVRQPAMLTYATSMPDLRPMLLFFVSDPSAGSAATSALNAIYTAHLEKQSQSTLADRLKELASQYPRFAPLQIYLINLYYQKLGRIEDAVSVGSVAVRAMPDSPQVAQANVELLLDAGRWPEALAAARRWRDNMPAQALAATVAEAKALVGLNQSVEAVNLLKPMVDASAGTDAGPVVLQAYVDAQKAAGVQPDIAALMQPMLSRGAAGRLQWMRFAVTNMSANEADAWLRRASEEMPDNASDESVMEHIALSEMYSSLSIRSAQASYAQTARAILEKLAKVDRPNIAVLLALGTRLDMDEKWTDAAANYSRVLEAQPANLLALNNLAMDLARMGHASKGIPFIDAAVKAVPEAPELLDTRAFVQMQAGHVDLALIDMREAVRLAPAQPRYRLRLIQMLVDSNNKKDAADQMKALEALNFDPHSLNPEQTKQFNDLRQLLPAAASGS